MIPMIQVNQVSFSYSHQPYIENLHFQVKQGEIFGFLGPSGAGKSTLQKMLIGLLPNYTGSVIVNGIEVKQHTNSFYEDIGVDFEFPSLYEKLTARENLSFFGSLYKKTLIPVITLLEMVDLQHHADKRVSDFSKGMKSRLNFIKALIHQPTLLFLDEPTSGLDPANARTMKAIIKELRDQGKTIILTTHNMHDAAELCDRVAFIVDGSIQALDTPRHLMMSRGTTYLEYCYMEESVERLRQASLDELNQDHKLQELIRHNRIISIHSKEPTLEDVFVDITGRRLQ